MIMLKLEKKAGLLSKTFDKFKNYLFESNIYQKHLIQTQMNDFKERLFAINNFQKYIEDQTSFTLEKKICKDANNEHLESLRKDINSFLDQYKL